MEQIVALKGEIVALKGEIVPLKGEIVPLKGEIVALKEQIVPLMEQIAPLKGESDIQQQIILEIRKEILEIRKEIVSKEQQIVLKEQQILAAKKRRHNHRSVSQQGRWFLGWWPCFSLHTSPLSQLSSCGSTTTKRTEPNFCGWKGSKASQQWCSYSSLPTDLSISCSKKKV